MSSEDDSLTIASRSCAGRFRLWDSVGGVRVSGGDIKSGVSSRGLFGASFVDESRPDRASRVLSDMVSYRRVTDEARKGCLTPGGRKINSKSARASVSVEASGDYVDCLR
jgi:hypothetical protein